LSDAKPRFFADAAAFGKWLKQNHARAESLLVGFHKVGSGKPSMTWPQSVDEALCWGWIDGVRRRIDDERYCIRFTPRKKGSTWSTINIKRVEALSGEGRMQPAGLKAFEGRRESRSGQYSYEQRPGDLPEPYAAMLAKNTKARKFFDSQIPSYRRAAIWWVISAKQEDTRVRRLKQLVQLSAKGKWIPQFLPYPRRKVTTSTSR
jgi:uncharacterized protein YdeI (YjbR/CyaY-like superfamily)